MTSLWRKWAKKVGWGQPLPETSDYNEYRYIGKKIYLFGVRKRVFCLDSIARHLSSKMVASPALACQTNIGLLSLDSAAQYINLSTSL